MNNKDVREVIKKEGLRHWQVAKIYGLNDGNFSRLLRDELPIETKKRVFQAVAEAKKEFAN